MKAQIDKGKLKDYKLLTKPEAATYIGICPNTLESIISRDPDFPPITRIGTGRGRVFIDRVKLDAWIDAQAER